MSTLAERIKERKAAREAEQNPVPKISQAEVITSAWVWQLGVVAIDIATSYIVWQITFLFYGIVWFVAGAGGLLWSERQRQRVGNNDIQRAIGETGVTVSLVAVIVMAVGSGVAYILGYSRLGWIEAITLVSAVGLFFYHVIQARRFHVLDDEFIERSIEARREAEHKRDLREIERARREVEKEKELDENEGKQRSKHGDAFDAAYTKKQSQEPRQNPIAPRNPNLQTGVALAQGVQSEELAETDPNARRGGKQ